MAEKASLQREVFEISRELEFFSEKELDMRMGHSRDWWGVVLLKELIDNALDACEMAGVPPVVEIETTPEHFSVRDNGPGLPEDTLRRSLNFRTRTSDKLHYVSPTRGQLGNALMLVWAAPYVASGEHGRVEVWSQGLHHTVDVSLDRIAQQPTIVPAVEESQFVRNGTLVRIHLPLVRKRPGR